MRSTFLCLSVCKLRIVFRWGSTILGISGGLIWKVSGSMCLHSSSITAQLFDRNAIISDSTLQLNIDLLIHKTAQRLLYGKRTCKMTRRINDRCATYFEGYKTYNTTAIKRVQVDHLPTSISRLCRTYQRHYTITLCCQNSILSLNNLTGNIRHQTTGIY